MKIATSLTANTIFHYTDAKAKEKVRQNKYDRNSDNPSKLMDGARLHETSYSNHCGPLSSFPEGEMKRCDPKTIEAARKANRYK